VATLRALRCPIRSARSGLQSNYNGEGRVSINLIRPWVFLTLFALLVLTLIWLLIMRSGKGAAPTLIAAVVCAFFSDSDSFELFKFSAQGGLEARARTVVAEVQTATQGLQNVAVAASVAIVNMNAGFVSNGGMAMTPPAATQDQTKRQMIAFLRSIGVTESQLATVEAADHSAVMRQYAYAIMLRAESICGRKGVSQDCEKVRSLSDANEFYSPKKVSDLLASLTFQDIVTNELAKDFEYYDINGKQRREEVWAARDDWSRDIQ
jgi:hypothetical protein